MAQKDKPRIGKRLKRFVACALAIAMTFTDASFASLAAPGKDDAAAEEKLQQELSKDKDKYPQGMFGFYEAQVQGTEGGEQELVVVRRGGTEGKASVELRAVDVSAAYGEDYLMTVGEGFFGSRTLKSDSTKGEGKTLVEEYADSLSVKEETKDVAGETTAPEDNPTEGEASAETLEASNGSSLAQAKQAQTGVLPVQSSWREIDGSKVDEASAEDLLRDGEESVRQMAEQKASVIHTLEFEDGEYRKTIKLSLLDDDRSESQEQVMFVLGNEEGAGLDSAYTAYLNIADNDEKEDVVFAMAEKNVTANREEGEVKVRILRTKGTDQMSIVTVGTSAETAVPGEDYETHKQDVVFPAGMTEKEVSIKLLNSGKNEECSFYVGLESKDGTVDQAASATLVTIGKNVEGGVLTTVGTADKTETPLNSNKTFSVSNSANSRSSYYVTGELDLETASQVKITFESTEGSYTYEKKCDKYTARGRKVEIKIGTDIGVRGKEQSKTVWSGSGDRIEKQTVTVNLDSGLQAKKRRVWASVTTTGENRNASLTVSKVEVIYPTYTFNIDNNFGVNPSTKAPINTTNTYVEQIYSGSGKNAKRNGDVMRLGSATVNGASSAAVNKSTDKLQFAASVDTSQHNSAGVHVDSNRVKFKGWQLQSKSNTNNWSSTITSNITLNKSFLNSYSGYINNGNITVRPVFEVQPTTVKFNNTQKKADGSTKGGYGNYSDNASVSATLLDTFEVTGVAKTGYAVVGFNLTEGDSDKNQKAASQISTGRKDSMKFAPGKKVVNVDLLYDEPSITVKADPKGNNTGKGGVVYTDTANNVALAGKAGSPMIVKPVSLNKEYRIVGVPEDGYVTYWRDGTLDGATDGKEDGVIDEKEQNTYKEYSSFTPVQGNVLAYVPTLSFAKLYYDFYPTVSIVNPLWIEGRVYLKQTELLTGKETQVGVNGAQVSTGNQSDWTFTQPKTRKQAGGDGYFELYEDSFGAYSYHLVNVSYTGKNGGSVATSAVCTPGLFKNLIIDANEKMWVEKQNAAVYTVEKDESGNVTSQTKVENIKEVNNGDTTFRISLKISHIPSVQPKTATLRFYRKDDGTAYDATVTAQVDNKNGDTVDIDFNPKDLGLAKGTRVTIQFEDSNGNKMLEQETGITLAEAIGTLDLINSFEFGGANTAIQIIGSIDSQFNLGWNGDFDKNDAVTTTTNEDGLTIRTVSLGFATSGIEKDKELAGLSKVTEDKTANDEALAEAKRDLAAEKDPAKKAELQKAVTEATAAKEKSDAAYDQELAKTADPAKTTTTMAANVSLDVGFKFAMSFVLDEETSAWYFHNMMVYANVEGGASVNMDFATPIGITISISFGAGGDGSALFVVEERKDQANPKKYYLTDLKSENSDKINIFDFNEANNDRAFDAAGTFEVNPYIMLSAGGSLAGLIGVKVDGRAEFFMTFYTDDQNDEGSVTLTASIGVSVLFINASWPFASTNIPLFGDEASVLAPLEEQNYLYDPATVFTAADRPYLKNRSSFNGSGMMGAMSVQEDGAGVVMSTLQEGVYGRMNAKMAKLDDGRILAVYLDDDGSRTAENAATAYYIIYGGEKWDQWSQPQPLEDDGTLDQAPVIEDMGDDGVFIAWSTANRVFREGESGVDMQNSLNIHAVICDKKTGKMGNVMEVTKDTDEDTVADVNPNVSYSDGKMLVYYTKNEYEVPENVTEEAVGDIIHPSFSLMAYRSYDMKTGTWKDTYTEAEKQTMIDAGNVTEETYPDYVKNWYGQTFLNTAPGVYIEEELDENGYWTKEPTIYPGYDVKSTPVVENTLVDDSSVTVSGSSVSYQSEPEIVDSDAIAYDGISVFAYVIDYDNDKSTVNDRDIYMQLYDFAEDTFSHPIMVTSDNVEDANVRFARVGAADGGFHSTYLTYLSGGDIKALNVSMLVGNANDADSPSLLKSDKGGEEYYYINRAADSENYEPPMTVVEGAAQGEDAASSAITGFDVVGSGDYLYCVWTQRGFELAEGVEEGTPEADDPENQKVEAQVYAMRYDAATGESTDAVQVTEGSGLIYDNLAFTIQDDGSLKMLATVTDNKVESYEDFVAEAEEYNKTAAADKKIDIPSEEDYVAYTAASEENTELVSMDVNCSRAYLAIEDVTVEDPASGQDNSVRFTIRNEGLGRIDDVEVSVKGKNGEAALVQNNSTAADGTVEETRTETLAVGSLRGGESWEGQIVYPLAEDETDLSGTIKVKAGGKVVAEQKFDERIESALGVRAFEVEETENRDEYTVKATVDNLSNRISAADTLDVTVAGKDGSEHNVASFDIPKLAQGESYEIEETVAVDSGELFVTEDQRDDKGELLAKVAKGDFTASVDGSSMGASVEQYVSAEAYSYVEGIQEAVINDGKGVSVPAGEYEKVELNVKSSLADEAKGLTGTEGLQVLWASEDESIVKAYQGGYIQGVEEGTAKLYAYAMPQDEGTLLSETEADGDTSSYDSETVSGYASLPAEAIKVYETTVTVGKASAGETENPPAENPPTTGDKLAKVGQTVKFNNQVYQVTKSSAKAKEVAYKGTSKKSAKTLTIPATVKVGNVSYKVTSIKANALKGNKSLQKLVVGKNVATVGKAAFKNCQKLSSISFKGTALKKIEASAFEGCKKLKSLTVPKNVRTIGQKAFYGCTALKKVVFKTGKKTTIGKNAFGKTAAKATFSVPKKYLKAYQKALKAAKIGKKATVKGR